MSIPVSSMSFVVGQRQLGVAAAEQAREHRLELGVDRVERLAEPLAGRPVDLVDRRLQLIDRRLEVGPLGGQEVVSLLQLLELFDGGQVDFAHPIDEAAQLRRPLLFVAAEQRPQVIVDDDRPSCDVAITVGDLFFDPRPPHRRLLRAQLEPRAQLRQARRLRPRGAQLGFRAARAPVRLSSAPWRSPCARASASASACASSACPAARRPAPPATRRATSPLGRSPRAARNGRRPGTGPTPGDPGSGARSAAAPCLRRRDLQRRQEAHAAVDLVGQRHRLQAQLARPKLGLFLRRARGLQLRGSLGDAPVVLLGRAGQVQRLRRQRRPAALQTPAFVDQPLEILALAQQRHLVGAQRRRGLVARAHQLGG